MTFFDITSAYAFYISEAQQVFADGHKRTGLGACLEFLRLNGVPTEHYVTLNLYDWMMQLALKQIDRAGFAERLRGPFE
jgi:prophage maintenance system killer protein